jgi:SHS2 domain-containing protein
MLEKCPQGWRRRNPATAGKALARRKQVDAHTLPFKRLAEEIKGMHETFDHTADLGLRVTAPDLDTLFAEAAQALIAAVVVNPEAVRPLRLWEVNLPADEPVYLLFDWLKELLFRFDTEHELLSKFEVRVSAAGLRGKAWGEPYDPGRHELDHEVKAITYHNLRLEQTADGWLAEVIVDI